jgi:hypothetical protein
MGNYCDCGHVVHSGRCRTRECECGAETAMCLVCHSEECECDDDYDDDCYYVHGCS